MILITKLSHSDLNQNYKDSLIDTIVEMLKLKGSYMEALTEEITKEVNQNYQNEAFETKSIDCKIKDMIDDALRDKAEILLFEMLPALIQLESL